MSWLRRLFARRAGRGRGGIARDPSPTASIYFVHPLDEAIASGTIKAVTPSLFVSASAAVVLRHVGKAELRLLAGGRFERIAYLLDDDLWSAEEAQLPSAYMRKLIQLRDGPVADLLNIATDVVSPSSAVLARFPHLRTHTIHPAMVHAYAPLAHHDNGGPLRLIHSGTASHLRDFEFVAPALAEFLRANRSASLTTFSGNRLPAELRGLANVDNRMPMTWSGYAAFAASHRFHVAVCPALPTAFNAARSLSRVHDNAAFGAAGLYSAGPPFAGAVTTGRNGLLIENSAGHWHSALRALNEDRKLTGALAAGGQQLSRSIGAPETLRRFWQELMLLA